MRVTEAAAKSGLGVDTIRYYEKSDMLPEVHRGPDGRRCFSAENVEWLSLLSSLRDTGMSIKTMRRFAALYRAGDHTIPERKAILVAHAERLKKRRANLDRCEALLAYKISIYEGGNALKLMQWSPKSSAPETEIPQNKDQQHRK